MTNHPRTLYRFYDLDNQLLYVGLSVNPGRRMEKHLNTKTWWQEVARIEMDQHPDMETLRAAESEAIKTERPRYNIRMNRPPVPASLVWTCEACETEIPDYEGYITISYAEIRAYRAADRAFQEKLDGQEFRVYSLADPDIPEEVHWQILHRRCDPTPDSDDYWISVERIRNQDQLLHWTAHLLRKTWITSTSWPSILHRVAA